MIEPTMRKPFRRLLYVTMALAVLVLSGLAIVSSLWFRDVLERRVAASLHDATGARVEIGEMKFNPFILQMTFHNLILHGTEDAAQPALFTAKSVVVRVPPAALLRRKLVLTRLDLTGAEVHLTAGKDGSTNLPGPESLSTSRASSLQGLSDLAIGRVTVSQTSLFFNSERIPLEADAQNVAVQMQRKRLQGYTGSFSSTAIHVNSPRIDLPATTLTSRFEISPSGIDLNSIDLHSDGMSMHSALRVSLTPETQAHLSYNATSPATQLARIFKLGRVSSGNVRAEGEADYKQGAWQSSGQIVGQQIRPPAETINSGPIDFKLKYVADPGKIQVPELQVAALGGTLQGKGAVSLQSDSPAYTLHAEMRGIHLSAALASLSIEHPLLKYLHLSAEVRGTTDSTWTGNFENLQSRFDLSFRTRAGAPAETFPVNGVAKGLVANAHGIKLQFDSIDLQTPHSTLTAKGTIQSAQSDLDAKLVVSDFEEWRTAVEYLASAREPVPLVLEDPLTFSGAISGTMDQPIIRGRIAVQKFEFRGWSWDELGADLVASPVSVEITRGRLRSERSVLTIDTAATLHDWQVDPNGPAYFSAIADQTPLAGLKAALGVDTKISGLATGQVDLNGTPASLAGDGGFKVVRGNLYGQPFDSLAGNFHLAESAWTIENIELTRGKARIAGRGDFNPATQAFSADLKGTDISLADFEAPPAPDEEAAGPKRLEGLASFSLKGHGTPANVELRADWEVPDLKVMGMRAGGIHGALIWQNQKLRITGESDGTGGSLHFEGEAQTQDNWPITLIGNYSNFLVSPWIRLLLSSKLDAQVKANGELKVEGPLREPEKLAIQSRISTLEVDTSNLAWKNADPVEIRYANRRLSISRFRIEGPATNVEAEGTIRFGPRPSVSLTAQGESDATLLSLLDPAIKATGHSKMDLRINGTPAQPLVFGTLTVQDVNLAYGDLPFHLSGMSGEVRLEGERATITSLRGMSGGGSVSVQGYMTYAETPRFQLTTKLDQVRIQYPPEFTSQLTGTLRLNGTSENSRLEGDLIVRQLFAAPSFNVLSLMSEVGNPAISLSIGSPSPVADSVRLNVQVFSAPTVRLETQDLRLVADIDLHLQGTLASPVVVGSIRVLNGEAILRGNRYKVNRADINMTNPFRTQPILDVEATTRIQSYDLTLDASGPLDQIKIAYRSDPPLPTADVLSLLALGYSRQQGGQTTSGQDSFSTMGASALLSEALSSQVTGRIQRLFGVSRIKIDPNSGGPENVSGARVTVEQQVTRELTLTYITDTGSTQRRVVQFEWQVSDNVSFLGVRDRNGIFGVEVKFRRRFR
jgi:translocation and assembly module TamB